MKGGGQLLRYWAKIKGLGRELSPAVLSASECYFMPSDSRAV